MTDNEDKKRERTELAVAAVTYRRREMIAEGHTAEDVRRGGIWRATKEAERAAKPGHECGLYHHADLVEAAAILVGAIEAMDLIAEGEPWERHDESRCE